jgi:hypothetical protein
MGAVLQCTMGIGPGQLVATPGTVKAKGMMVATVMDKATGVNVPPFPLCKSQLNPTVAAATAAAMGTPTPAACVPTLPGPWVVGSPTVKMGGKSVLTVDAKCICAYGGQISITSGGAATTVKAK